MRRFILPIAAILLTTACGGSGGHSASASAHASPRSAAKKSSHVAAAPTKSASNAAKQKPKPSRSSKTCEPTRDVIVWYKTPELPDSAQVLGNYYVATCETTFQSLTHTSPTGAGYCTEAAWASDNPGYNADATPAKRLKKVQVAVGPAC
ncbi:hypothetical protein [Streptomyces glomeratus]|uniref:hypothetical protein n=1 Tax=Streptomyces glomeratus TaxID=284452 RepID=UPI001F1D89E4|nr:hypothetical protein [Streptomyces glomeratus]MCF1510104.1 hypothetical protein [Streptomyces glomeratus]